MTNHNDFVISNGENFRLHPSQKRPGYEFIHLLELGWRSFYCPCGRYKTRLRDVSWIDPNSGVTNEAYDVACPRLCHRLARGWEDMRPPRPNTLPGPRFRDPNQ